MIAAELSNATYLASGVDEPFHNCSHHQEIPENIARLSILNEYHLRNVMGFFVARLAATPDGDGSLLDHSLVFYGSGMGDSQNHDHSRLPAVLAGGASGRMAGGKHVQMPSGTPLSNLLVTMLDKLDVPVDRFADSTGTVPV
jgi:hypothetical protein